MNAPSDVTQGAGSAMEVVVILRTLLAAVATVAIPVTLLGAEPEPRKSNPTTRKICEVSGVIGSRLGTVRRCRTKAEWEEARREARQAVDRYQHLKVSICNGGRALPPSQGGSSSLGGTCG
jgi:hypothetical protein